MDESNKVKIKEGSTEIFTEGHVFYNPVQQFNRDLSICVLNAFSKQYQNELKNKKSAKSDTVENVVDFPFEVGVKSEVSVGISLDVNSTNNFCSNQFSLV